MADQITVNAGAALPEYEKKRTFEKVTPGDVNTSEQTVEAPARLEAGAGLEAAGAGELAAAKEGQARADAAAPIQREAAAQSATVVSQQADAKLAAMNEAAADIARARDRTRARQAELDAMDSPTLFGNTDAHGKVLRGVGIALGGIGDAIQRAAMVRIGKSPPTIDTVSEMIDGILGQQREHINKLKDSVVMARTGETDAVEARSRMLADVDLKGAAMLGRVKALMESRLAAMGKTPDQIAADANIVAVTSKIADKKAEHVAPLLNRITKKLEGPTVKSGSETTDRVPGKAAGAAPTGATADQSAKLAKYVDEHPQASQGELVGVAKDLGIPDAQGEVTRVAGANSLPEKEQERQTLDYEGKPVLTSTARGGPKAVADQVSNTKRYVAALDALIDTIGEGGIAKAVKSHVPGTDISNKAGEVVALGAPAMGFTLSDSRKKLDEAISGTGGVGVLSGNAVEQLKNLRKQAIDYAHDQISRVAQPVRSAGAPPRATQSPPAKSDQVAEAKAWLVSPAARANPAKRKAVYDKLKSMGVTF